MSGFVWMKFLESAPERYDRGIHMLSRGRIDAIYARIAQLAASPGKRVLDIGCGTGGAAFACAARGAVVTGIDSNAGMLEVAQRKALQESGRVEFLELGAAEIEDRFGPASFDAVVACLVMSELSPAEQDYALGIAHSRLVPGGVIVIADETVPEGGPARLVYWLRRVPVAAVTYLLTQATTRPVSGLAAQLRAAGFAAVAEERFGSTSFVIVHGRKP